MSEALKERKEMDPQYQWDLTKMYASDAEWEKAFAAIDPKIEALAAWEGKLNNAASIREFYDAEIGVFRELENLAVYTSLRLSEDTRADDAQSMDARATAKYVKASVPSPMLSRKSWHCRRKPWMPSWLTSRLPPIVLLWKTCCVQSLTP